MNNLTNLKNAFGLILFLFFSASFAQSGVQLVWDQEVACQTYGNTDPDPGKYLFIEDIEDDVCLQFCKNTPVKFRLFNAVNEGISASWVVNGRGVHDSSAIT